MKSVIVERFSVIWNFAKWLKDNLIILSRLKDVFIMMLLFHIWPDQTYRFSTRKFLPCKKNRFFKESKPAIPFDLLKTKSDNIPLMKEINVISHGSSFDLNNLKILNGQTFLVSFWYPLRENENGDIFYYEPEDVIKKSYNQKELKFSKEFKKKDLTYVIGRAKVVERLKRSGNNVFSLEVHAEDKDGSVHNLRTEQKTPSYFSLFDDDHCRRILITEKIYRPSSKVLNNSFSPSGSFLPALCALSHFAEKINVYGWDFYLESSPENMNYWELFFNMYKFRHDVKRSKNHFESALINFYYAYKLSKLPNIHIHGYLGQLGKHEKLIKRIERVLFQ